MISESKYENFVSQKCIWKSCLQMSSLFFWPQNVNYGSTNGLMLYGTKPLPAHSWLTINQIVWHPLSHIFKSYVLEITATSPKGQRVGKKKQSKKHGISSRWSKTLKPKPIMLTFLSQAAPGIAIKVMQTWLSLMIVITTTLGTTSGNKVTVMITQLSMISVPVVIPGFPGVLWVS